MKQVISEKQQLVVEVPKVNSDKYYGCIQRNLISLKGFVVREAFDRGDFYLYANDKLTRGNTFCSIRYPTLKQTIEKALRTMDVYEFDTPQELFQWLAK